ncbi:alpha/beta fold hydrolase [Geodermatophilus sp. DSM 44513]|uniref:alpha/beta fold hydrolase n=1 Tax=Geodermatophilus sp. DSM 44513 TaxID=1528104 RepID=UPI00127D8C13|nr:alpha/beta hydrolase [Geodermatophilus sp. DSM 44513]WNV75789.1 alpha/beta hydrolase [Geodermatophilus sp. DSM 44513]
MRFVLVHGSWHDGGCWDGVRHHLEAAGHEVHAPTLPGNGPAGDPAVTMTQVVDAVVDLLEDGDLRDVVLVGHSFGGAVVQQVALRVPARLRRMVFHNAYVVRDGAAVFDEVPASVAPAFQALAEAAGDGTVMLPFESFRDGFCNDADLDTARAAYARMTPEPLARSTEPLALAGFAELPVPRSYLHATDDNVFPAAEFSWHPGMSSRLGAFRLVQMHGSHEVLFSDPAGLADKLVEAGRD